jgi:nucleoid DNA-binding protein
VDNGIKYTKTDVISAVSKASGLKQSDVRLVIESMFAELTKTLASGKHVELRGLGTFDVRTRDERQARNPQTNEGIISPAHRVVVFHPSKQLKLAVWNIPSAEQNNTP